MIIDEYDKAYFEFHQGLLNAFIEQVKEQPPFNLEHPDIEDSEFLSQLIALEHIGGSEHLIQGQALICKIVAAYPHLMPILPRDLLWFFGGDCLHYMPDDEIAIFQSIDEKREEAKKSSTEFSYIDTRKSALRLH